jgi:D-3-phosphoglycerate dehydrogenase
MKTSYPKDKINILLLENISSHAVRQFRENGYGNITELKGAPGEDELIDMIREVHVLGIRSKTLVTQRVIDAADKLLAIGCFCIGTDQVDLESAELNGVAVFNAPFSNTRSVAEITIASFFILIRNILHKNNATHAGRWEKAAGQSYELRGKKLGIIGYGNIGSQVSILAEALGMSVSFYDIDKKLPLGNAQQVFDLKDLVASADVVSLHVPSTAHTQLMINEDLLLHFKKGSYLVNYGRGDLMDLEAVKRFIDSGVLSGVAVDVYPCEPSANGEGFVCPLQNIPNVLLTPHIGGSTEEAQINIGGEVSNKLISFIETGNTQGSLSVPGLTLPQLENAHRILHIHRNVPGVLSSINSLLAAHGINILAQYLTTKKNIGYVVLDIDKDVSGETMQLLRGIRETIRLRMLY